MENMQENLTSVPEPKFKKMTGKRWIISALILVLIAYFAGYQTGRKGFVYNPKSFSVINQANAPKTVDYNLLWDAINVLNTKYIDKPVDPQQVLYGAISGAVASVGDPYTEYFTPQALNDFKTSLSGQFDGIGAEITKKDSNIVVVAPLDDTPAQKAGLKAQDIILKVDGQDATNWTSEQAVNKIRGPKGTSVTLTILHSGSNKPVDIKILRDTIVLKSVKWSYKDTTVNGQQKHIAIITINQFGDDTEGLFNQAVNDVLSHSVDGLVIDLRNNPGGYLQTAVDIASNWVAKDQVVVTEARSDGTSQAYNSSGSDRLASIPTTVLINGGSASAAEILSGALHDHNIAKLVGEKSFGKGSVQEVVSLSDGSAVKVTVAKWITPNGKNLNKDGLDPDYPVTLTDQDVAASKDPQMDKAIQVVTGSVK